MKASGLVGVSFYLLYYWFLAFAAPASEVPLVVSADSREVFQGGVVRIRVSGTGLVGARGVYHGRPIVFFPGERKGSYSALLGVDLGEKSGPTEVIVQGRGKGQRERDASVVLQVRERRFPTERLTVPPSLDRFDEPTLRRIEREKERMALLWNTVHEKRWWRGPFILPVSGEVTSVFGLRRIINGSSRSPHGGVDLRAPLGTEVIAANHGRVVLRDEFFFSGKSIVLDHGGGLYTMYFHLRDFRVRTGSLVRKGEVIGWAGMTGRATGPHLHWGVRLNGARVDPFALLAHVGGSR